MKKMIFLLMIFVVFLSIASVSANEISENNTYVQISSNSLSVDDGVWSDLSTDAISAVNVSKKDVTIDAPDIKLYYKNGTRFVATLTDIDGNKLANQSLIFAISGVNYTRTTDSSGSASIAINLLPGTYDLITYYAGDDFYCDAKVTSQCDIYPTVGGKDVIKYYRNETQYYATFLNGDGSPLTNSNVTFNINGVMYTRLTNATGIARLNINLKPDTYTITAIHPKTNYMYSNKITVLSTISSQNIVKMQGNDTQYFAKFLNGYGSPLANGTSVSFNINGILYQRKTNENGTARLNINLSPGNYIITATNPFNEDMASSNILVLSKISENNNLVKYFKNDSQYVVKIIGDDGNAVGSDEIVKFNINGVIYERKTNESGHAKMNINLAPGKYIITAMYGVSSISNNIVVKPILSADDISMINRDGTKFKAKLLDGQGNNFAGQNITFNINGVFYNRTTGSDGVASLNINLDKGVYIITSSYNGAMISNSILIKLKTSQISINNVISVSKSLRNYYLSHNDFPDKVESPIGGLTFYEAFYMINEAVAHIVSSNPNDVALINGIRSPDAIVGETLYSGLIKKAEYTKLSKELSSWMNNNNKVPNTISTSVGILRYDDYLVILNNVLNFYSNNAGTLPNYGYVISSKSVPTLNYGTTADNAYSIKGNKVFIDADGGSDAKKWDIARALSQAGWDVTVGDTFSNSHYEDYYNVPNNYILITLYNGFCAGTIRELASSYVQNLLKAKNVVCVPIWDTAGWTNPAGMAPYRYGDFRGYSADRAWDDDFSSTDPSIRNVDDYLYSNNIKYCAYPTTQGIINQFVKGGYFASVGR